MFLLEIVAGLAAGSASLQADALDFLADAANYGISLFVVGMAIRCRASAALAKGMTMGLFGVWVLATAIWHAAYGRVPEAVTMGAVGLAALLANTASFALLWAYRDGDSDMRSVWLCSRNDVIGNFAVLLAAVGVFGTGELAGCDRCIRHGWTGFARRLVCDPAGFRRTERGANMNGRLVMICLVAGVALASDRAMLSLPALSGEQQTLEQYHGRVVVLNFWATWCIPCREEMPLLVNIQKRYESKGVVVIGASADDESTQAQIPPFIQKLKITFLVWKGATTEHMERLGLGTGLPATAIIGPDGQIAFRILGIIERQALQSVWIGCLAITPRRHLHR